MRFLNSFKISNYFFHPAGWVPGLWLDIFDTLVDDWLYYKDNWVLSFNYSSLDVLDQKQKTRGWKIFCNRAHGKYVLFYSRNVSAWQ